MEDLRRCEHDLGEVVVRGEGAEDTCEDNDDHAVGRAVDSVLEALPDVLGVHGLADEAVDDAVYAGDDAGFGRGGSAGEDAADDDDRHDERGQRLEGVLTERPPADELRLGYAGLAGIDAVYDHVADGDDKTGDDTGHEQLADGDGGDAGVEHHHDARRDDRAESAAGGDEGAGVAVVIAVLAHDGDKDGGESGGVGVRGAGDARHHNAGDDGRVAEAALEVTDKALCPVDEDIGDTGLLHQGTGQHEERHCHEGEGVHTGEELLGDDYTGERGVKEKSNDGGNDHTVGDGHADEQQQEEQPEKNTKHHISSPSLFS